jgi:predicted rRNA methylase YqxC with S4 and FtsJ domains
MRLDELVLARGWAKDLHEAQALILTGRVRQKEQVLRHAGHSFPDDADLTLTSVDPYVSRGGV